jgi:hypothetical protein
VLIEWSRIAKHETMQARGWPLRRGQHLWAGQGHPKGHRAPFFAQQTRLITNGEDLFELGRVREGQVNACTDQYFLAAAVHRLGQVAWIGVRAVFRECCVLRGGVQSRRANGQLTVRMAVKQGQT